MSEGFWTLKMFEMALGVSTLAMAWWRKGSAEEDQAVSEAHDFVLETLSDADKVRTVDIVTGKNMRDQVSVEEAMALYEESRLRKFQGRN